MRQAQTTKTVEGPTAAERARTLAFGIADGVLVAPGVPYAPVPAHTTDRDGRPLLLVQSASPIASGLRNPAPDAEPDVPATLRISDVAPIALPDRVRGRAWLHGWLSELPDAELRAAALRLSHAHPRPELLDFGTGPLDRGTEPLDRGTERGDREEWTILALEVAQVEIEDAWGSATLEPEEYAAAAPDPFVAVESGILTHLDLCHRDELTGLLPESVPPGTVRPLGLDRYGMWLRRTAAPSEVHAAFDLRLPFAEPVSDLHGLRCVYRRLFARATP
ncbi:DUF2470 domain-containing protein [Actinomadura soli]|uniref:DUF2470 domain-containing protein n=1 Tax=Actinomadura soli TaxID=2508997 RepID=A0A5C4J093_9ACTN|nr:DUF2470 domain-containing protein [Actinomadura soli]TMQ90026.1 DUF2470 domain-containing protein [Actinomadura soli]